MAQSTGTIKDAGRENIWEPILHNTLYFVLIKTFFQRKTDFTTVPSAPCRKPFDSDLFLCHLKDSDGA